MFTKKELLSVILETKKRRFVPVEQKKEKVIQNALANYAKGCKREEIVAIYDTTIMGNGKQGFCLQQMVCTGISLKSLKDIQVE